MGSVVDGIVATAAAGRAAPAVEKDHLYAVLAGLPRSVLPWRGKCSSWRAGSRRLWCRRKTQHDGLHLAPRGQMTGIMFVGIQVASSPRRRRPGRRWFRRGGRCPALLQPRSMSALGGVGATGAVSSPAPALPPRSAPIRSYDDIPVTTQFAIVSLDFADGSERSNGFLDQRICRSRSRPGHNWWSCSRLIYAFSPLVRNSRGRFRREFFLPSPEIVPPHLRVFTAILPDVEAGEIEIRIP